MATLTANITADQGVIAVSGDVSAAVAKVAYRIDDEVVTLRAFGQVDPWSPRPQTNRAQWVVARGAEGTTPATHLAGAAIVAVEEAVTSSTTLVPPEPFAGEGGGGSGVTVDPGDGTPVPVTGFVAPGAVIDGDEATLGPSIAATDTQVVFMDGTDAVGSPNLTWTEIGRVLGFSAGENEGATIEGNGIGVQLVVQGGAGDATHVGGELTLRAGDSNGWGGGQLNITAGGDDGGGEGGPIFIEAGFATDGAGGDIDIRAGGSGAASAEGGSINILAGTGQTGDGGSIIIQAGNKVTGGSHGTIQLYEGSGNHSIEMNASGLFVFGGVINFDGLPSVDPEVAGQLYTNGVVSAGVPQPLMVSGGPA